MGIPAPIQTHLMEVIYMKLTKATIISLLAVTFVLAGVLIAGCTQSSSSAPAVSSPSSVNGGSPGGMNNENASYGNRPNFMQNLLNNATLLNSAASQLGVSEQDLQNALTPASGGRPNFTAAAQQLNIIPQQLRTALGFPSGGYHGYHNTSMATPGSGQ